MAFAPNTSSTLSLDNGINKTSVSLSTNILITVNNTAVGAIQTISVDEGRQVRFFSELGTDGHVDSAPTQSSTVTGSCQRIRFDRLRIAEAFSRGFIHVRSQVYPFDIVIIDKQKRDPASWITTTIKNVWIKQITTSYSATDWIISENMTYEGETIYSVLGIGKNSDVSVATGGERGIKHFGGGANGEGAILMGPDGKYNNIEQLTDTGRNGRRGSLDASGLIDIGDSGNLY